MAYKNKKSTLNRTAQKTAEGQKVSIIHTTLEVMPFHRTSQDIDSCRQAIQSFESLAPSRTRLYNLYADVELDGQVRTATSKIIEAVQATKWSFVDKEGKPNEQVNQLTKSIGFNNMLKEIVRSIWWGYTMGEPQFYKNDEDENRMTFYCIPRKHMRPELGIIAKYQDGDDVAFNVRSGFYAKTILEAGEPTDMGLHIVAALIQVLKRGGLGDWAMFVQVFGQPIVDAVWDGMDENQKVKLVEAIKVIGSGGALVRPAGTEVTMLQNNSAANGQLQESLITYLDKQLSKIYNGNTETTDSSTSSGYAQSKTHEGQDDLKKSSYIDFVKKILDDRFKPILAAAGFDVKGGEWSIEGEEETLTKKESFEIHKSMATELKVPIDDDFFYENYGVPKPANYNQLKAKQEEEAQAAKQAIQQQEASAGGPPPSGGRGVTGKQKGKPAEKATNLSDRSILVRLLSLFSSQPWGSQGSEGDSEGGNLLWQSPHNPERS